MDSGNVYLTTVAAGNATIPVTIYGQTSEHVPLSVYDGVLPQSQSIAMATRQDAAQSSFSHIGQICETTINTTTNYDDYGYPVASGTDLYDAHGNLITQALAIDNSLTPTTLQPFASYYTQNNVPLCYTSTPMCMEPSYSKPVGTSAFSQVNVPHQNATAFQQDRPRGDSDVVQPARSGLTQSTSVDNHMFTPPRPRQHHGAGMATTEPEEITPGPLTESEVDREFLTANCSQSPVKRQNIDVLLQAAAECGINNKCVQLDPSSDIDPEVTRDDAGVALDQNRPLVQDSLPENMYIASKCSMVQSPMSRAKKKNPVTGREINSYANGVEAMNRREHGVQLNNDTTSVLEKFLVGKPSLQMTHPNRVETTTEAHLFEFPNKDDSFETTEAKTMKGYVNLEVQEAFCQCSMKDRFEIPTEKVFKYRGKLFALMEVNIVSIGNYKYYALKYGEEYYIPILPLISHPTLLTCRKGLIDEFRKTKFSIHTRNATQPELDFLTEKYGLCCQSLISVTGIQEVCMAFSAICSNPYIKTLFSSSVRVKVLGRNSRCGYCGLTVQKVDPSDEAKPKEQGQGNTVNPRLERQRKRTRKQSGRQRTEESRAQSLFLENLGDEWISLSALNPMKEVLLSVGVMSLLDIKLNAYRYLKSIYVNVQEVVLKRIIDLKTLMKQLSKRARFGMKAIFAPDGVEEKLTENGTLLFSGSQWVDITSLRHCLYHMQKGELELLPKMGENYRHMIIAGDYEYDAVSVLSYMIEETDGFGEMVNDNCKSDESVLVANTNVSRPADTSELATIPEILQTVNQNNLLKARTKRDRGKKRKCGRSPKSKATLEKRVPSNKARLRKPLLAGRVKNCSNVACRMAKKSKNKRNSQKVNKKKGTSKVAINDNDNTLKSESEEAACTLANMTQNNFSDITNMPEFSSTYLSEVNKSLNVKYSRGDDGDGEVIISLTEENMSDSVSNSNDQFFVIDENGNVTDREGNLITLPLQEIPDSFTDSRTEIVLTYTNGKFVQRHQSVSDCTMVDFSAIAANTLTESITTTGDVVPQVDHTEIIVTEMGVFNETAETESNLVTMSNNNEKARALIGTDLSFRENSGNVCFSDGRPTCSDITIEQGTESVDNVRDMSDHDEQSQKEKVIVEYMYRENILSSDENVYSTSSSMNVYPEVYSAAMPEAREPNMYLQTKDVVNHCRKRERVIDGIRRKLETVHIYSNIDSDHTSDVTKTNGSTFCKKTEVEQQNAPLEMDKGTTLTESMPQYLDMPILMPDNPPRLSIWKSPRKTRLTSKLAQIIKDRNKKSLKMKKIREKQDSSCVNKSTVNVTAVKERADNVDVSNNYPDSNDNNVGDNVLYLKKMDSGTSASACWSVVTNNDRTKVSDTISLLKEQRSNVILPAKKQGSDVSLPAKKQGSNVILPAKEHGSNNLSPIKGHVKTTCVSAKSLSSDGRSLTESKTNLTLDVVGNQCSIQGLENDTKAEEKDQREGHASTPDNLLSSQQTKPETSPPKQASSPQKQLKSPCNSTPSPRKLVKTSGKIVPIPQKTTQSQQKQTRSQRELTSPQNLVPTPQQYSTSSHKKASPPKSRSTVQVKEKTSPNMTSSPITVASSPTKAACSLWNDTSSPQKPTPAEKVASPHKLQLPMASVSQKHNVSPKSKSDIPQKTTSPQNLTACQDSQATDTQNMTGSQVNQAQQPTKLPDTKSRPSPSPNKPHSHEKSCSPNKKQPSPKKPRRPEKPHTVANKENSANQQTLENEQTWQQSSKKSQSPVKSKCAEQQLNLEKPQKPENKHAPENRQTSENKPTLSGQQRTEKQISPVNPKSPGKPTSDRAERRKMMEESIKRYIRFSQYTTSTGKIAFRVKKFLDGAEKAFPAIFFPHPNNPGTRQRREKFMEGASQYVYQVYLKCLDRVPDMMDTASELSSHTYRRAEPSLGSQELSTPSSSGCPKKTGSPHQQADPLTPENSTSSHERVRKQKKQVTTKAPIQVLTNQASLGCFDDSPLLIGYKDGGKKCLAEEPGSDEKVEVKPNEKSSRSNKEASKQIKEAKKQTRSTDNIKYDQPEKSVPCTDPVEDRQCKIEHLKEKFDQLRHETKRDSGISTNETLNKESEKNRDSLVRSKSTASQGTHNGKQVKHTCSPQGSDGKSVKMDKETDIEPLKEASEKSSSIKVRAKAGENKDVVQGDDSLKKQTNDKSSKQRISESSKYQTKSQSLNRGTRNSGRSKDWTSVSSNKHTKNKRKSNDSNDRIEREGLEEMTCRSRHKNSSGSSQEQMQSIGSKQDIRSASFKDRSKIDGNLKEQTQSEALKVEKSSERSKEQTSRKSLKVHLKSKSSKDGTGSSRQMNGFENLKEKTQSESSNLENRSDRSNSHTKNESLKVQSKSISAKDQKDRTERTKEWAPSEGLKQQTKCDTLKYQTNTETSKEQLRSESLNDEARIKMSAEKTSGDRLTVHSRTKSSRRHGSRSKQKDGENLKERTQTNGSDQQTRSDRSEKMTSLDNESKATHSEGSKEGTCGLIPQMQSSSDSSKDRMKSPKQRTRSRTSPRSKYQTSSGSSMPQKHGDLLKLRSGSEGAKHNLSSDNSNHRNFDVASKERAHNGSSKHHTSIDNSKHEIDTDSCKHQTSPNNSSRRQGQQHHTDINSSEQWKSNEISKKKSCGESSEKRTDNYSSKHLDSSKEIESTCSSNEQIDGNRPAESNSSGQGDSEQSRKRKISDHSDESGRRGDSLHRDKRYKCSRKQNNEDSFMKEKLIECSLRLENIENSIRDNVCDSLIRVKYTKTQDSSICQTSDIIAGLVNDDFQSNVQNTILRSGSQKTETKREKIEIGLDGEKKEASRDRGKKEGKGKQMNKMQQTDMSGTRAVSDKPDNKARMRRASPRRVQKQSENIDVLYTCRSVDVPNNKVRSWRTLPRSAQDKAENTSGTDASVNVYMNTVKSRMLSPQRPCEGTDKNSAADTNASVDIHDTEVRTQRVSLRRSNNETEHIETLETDASVDDSRNMAKRPRTLPRRSGEGRENTVLGLISLTTDLDTFKDIPNNIDKRRRSSSRKSSEETANVDAQTTALDMIPFKQSAAASCTREENSFSASCDITNRTSSVGEKASNVSSKRKLSSDIMNKYLKAKHQKMVTDSGEETRLESAEQRNTACVIVTYEQNLKQQVESQHFPSETDCPKKSHGKIKMTLKRLSTEKSSEKVKPCIKMKLQKVNSSLENGCDVDTVKVKIEKEQRTIGRNRTKLLQIKDLSSSAVTLPESNSRQQHPGNLGHNSAKSTKKDAAEIDDNEKYRKGMNLNHNKATSSGPVVSEGKSKPKHILPGITDTNFYRMTHHDFIRLVKEMTQCVVVLEKLNGY